MDRLNVGGAALDAILTVAGLDRKHFRAILVSGSVEPGEADMSYLARDLAIEHVVIPTLGREIRPLRDIRTAYELWRLIRRVRPDIVHTQKSKAGAIGRVVSLLARVPVRVHTFHGHVFHGYFSPGKTRVFVTIERILAHITDCIIVLSPGLVSELSHDYHLAPPEHFQVMPCGFDLTRLARAQEFQGELRRELGCDDKVRLVGIVGRMTPIKDHATFIAAAALIAKQRPEVEFVFVGGGELEEVIRADLAKRGLTQRAHLLGWRRDLEHIYADLDVLALSSINEGTPVALIEAMAAAVPVASTDVGGVAEVLLQGKRGELAPAGDPLALAQAIERALEPAARARALAIRNDILTEFDNDQRCRNLEALYHKLLARR